MTFMKTRVQHEFAHVLSFRIQILVQPDDKISLLDSLVLKDDDTNYRVFFTFGDVCFKCKTAGRSANDCPIEVETPQTPITKSVTTIKDVVEKRQLGEAEILDLTGRTHKRHNHPVKKIKSSDSCESWTPVNDLLAPGKNLISSARKYPLSYDQTTEFMDKALGSSDVLGLIQTYTEDVDGVLHLLYDLYPVMS